MIPVAPAPEPGAFDARVRRPGRKHLARQPPPAKAKTAYWREALQDLCDGYDNTCAYLGIRIQPSTGFATADHFVPRQRAPELAYEWSNLRLAAHPVNTYKGASIVPIDPFAVGPGEFVLNLLSGEVEVGTTDRPDEVRTTIEVLRLNDGRFVADRLGFLDAYLADEISRGHLGRWFPFGEAELTRQGH